MAELTVPTKDKQEVQGQEQTRPGRYFLPPVDICEYEHGLKLWADMPGVTEQNVSVLLKDNILTIEGIISTEPYAALSPLYTEYNVGNFYRQFSLNESIDESKITAALRNGVLEVTLPKSERALPRRIAVTPG